MGEKKIKTQKTINGKAVPLTKSKSKKKKDSEFQAYTYIKNELKGLGWNVKNPNRDVKGQLYTQQECLGNPEIKSMLGRLTPEYVVKLREDAFWVIEAKPTLDEIDIAYNEAIEYGKLVNNHSFIRAMIVSGIAGNDIDKYYIKNGFWVDGEKDFKPVIYDGKELTSLLTPEIVKRLLDEKTPILKQFDIQDKQLLKTADIINLKFQEASIRKDKRATIVAAMLLSLLGETEPNYNDNPDVFVNDINGRAKDALERNGKESFFNYLEMQLPEKQDAKNKFKDALVDAFFVLRKINIKAAMRTGSDVLGRFYEAFLKYGNGAKDLGIVLTPRQITEFAADILNVSHRDVVYDPTSGTGGFLVSCFYRVKGSSNQSQHDAFRLYRIFGIDQQSNVATLAIVNMIFRGDGRNNIINDDCLARGLIATTIKGETSARFVSKDKGDKGQRAITKVLMNPPFSLKKSGEKEYRFVDHALEQMEDGGLLFSILPCAAMVKGRAYGKWRKLLLQKNTLLSVITLPDDLFYPQSMPPTLAIIVKKGVPHPHDQGVFWIKIENDGHRKIKGKRLPDPKVPNDLERVKSLIPSFIVNPNIQVENIPEFQKVATINFNDNALELVSEAYLGEKEPSLDEIKSGVEYILRDLIAFIIYAKKEEEFKKEVASNSFFQEVKERENYKFVEMSITDIFDIEVGAFHVSGILDEGKIPLISCSAEKDGLEGFFDIPEKETYKNAITIASDGQPLASFYHFYPFVAKDNVLIGIPKKEYKFTTMIYILFQLNRLRWRFSYGRKCYSNKIDKIRIFLPITKEKGIDEGYIEYLVKGLSSWDLLCKLFSD